MNQHLAKTLKNRIKNIKSFYAYSGSDKLATELLINNCYLVAKAVIDDLELHRDDTSYKEFLEDVEVLRHITNISRCSLHIGYSKDDMIMIDQIKEIVSHLEKFIDDGCEISSEVSEMYKKEILENNVKTDNEKLNLEKNLLKDMDKYTRCSKCLLFDGKVSDIQNFGWGDVCDYLEQSRKEGGNIYSLDMFKDVLKQSMLNLGDKQPSSE